MQREITSLRAIRAISRTHGVDTAVAALAERQDGVVGRDQLVALGLKRDAIRRRALGGRLHRVWPGVYAVGHRRLSQRGVWFAAVLAAGKGGVLCHGSAAALHGFAPDRGRVVHVRSTKASRPGLRCHRIDLAPEEITTRQGIPVTTPARTLLDLAATSNARTLERALREALFARAVSSGAVRRLLLNHEGDRGAGALKRSLQRTADAPGRHRSRVEERFANWLRKQDLPQPSFNQELHIDGERLELDCYWPAHRLVAEIDHRATHTRRQDFERDRARDRKLLTHGLRTVRITEPYDACLAHDLARLLSGSS